MKTGLGVLSRRLALIGIGMSALVLAPKLLSTQEPAPPPAAADSSAPETPAGPPVKVSGVVLNATTGEPLSRALVKFDGNPSIGALTDHEGRFEIPAVPQGVQNFEVIKPGYHSPGENDRFPVGSARAVRVADSMPELQFSLTQDNVISGRVTLSTGIAGEGIGLELLKRNITNGRPTWISSTKQQTTPAGEFRFSGVLDGTYLLRTQPEFENTRVREPACNNDAPSELKGYAPIFYGGSDDLAGASRIVVKGGQTAEASLPLNLTTYRLIQVAIMHSPIGDNWNFEQTLFDHSGQETDYPIHEEKGKSLCVYLPDGAYSLWETAVSNDEAPHPSATGAAPGAESSVRIGLLEFSIDGHSERNQRLSLGPGAQTPVHLSYQPGPPKPRAAQNPDPNAETNAAKDEEMDERESEPLGEVAASPVNELSSSNASDVSAEQVDDHTYAFDPAPTGGYWIHLGTGAEGTCIGQVTAAGQDLATSPWIVGTAGTGAPIDVVVRTDCATLTLEMPATLAETAAGEGTTFYVYVIPEFPSTNVQLSAQIEQFGDRSQKLEDITPGAYRVFTFRRPRSLEYRNPAALERLGEGQEINLQPGDNATLVVQEISQ